MYNTPYQLKLPLEIEKIIEISDPVYTFSEVLSGIDLKRYLVIKENRTGRKRFDSETLLKVILFAFMKHGYMLYSVVSLFLAENVSGELKITDGESLKLQYFDFNNLPNLESRAKTMIDWIKENRKDLILKKQL